MVVEAVGPLDHVAVTLADDLDGDVGLRPGIALGGDRKPEGRPDVRVDRVLLRLGMAEGLDGVGVGGCVRSRREGKAGERRRPVW